MLDLDDIDIIQIYIFTHLNPSFGSSITMHNNYLLSYYREVKEFCQINEFTEGSQDPFWSVNLKN